MFDAPSLLLTVDVLPAHSAPPAARFWKRRVCRPGLAHRRLTPANREALLFDDVIWVDKAIEDHDFLRA
jgi:hypothetical protein